MIEIPFRAALLDMDGTLVNSDAVVERTWRNWAARTGLAAADVLAVVHGRQGHESMALLLPERDAATNRAESRAMLAAERDETDGVVAIPGAAELLAALEELGVPHALVTSADEPLATARMAAAGLAVPQIRVTAERVTRSKPHPEGFVRGAELLGIAVADCVVFEDSIAGIAAGRDAGMTVIGIGKRAAAGGADHLVTDLNEIEVARTAAGFVLRLPRS